MVAKAPSNLILLFSTVMVMSQAAVIDESAAPAMRTSISLMPVSKKAMTTPGNAACDRPSPMRLSLRSTAKLPAIPLARPNNAVPSSTICVV